MAPQGRDQLVRVVYPGFLFPFGHSTTLVKITERKMLDAAPSVAGLFQRKFLAVGEPLRLYDQRDLPFSEIRIQPLMTPTIVPEPSESDAFVPYVGGAPFVWILHYLDKEGRPGRLAMPLVCPLILDAKIPRPKACSTARIERRVGERAGDRLRGGSRWRRHGRRDRSLAVRREHRHGHPGHLQTTPRTGAREHPGGAAAVRAAGPRADLVLEHVRDDDFGGATNPARSGPRS